jgi:type IV pilus assembly protein PilB
MLMAGKKQLGQILLEAGVIDEFQLKSALGYQKQWGGRLGKVLVENRFISEDALVEAVHNQTGTPVVRLDELTIPDYLIKLVPVELATRHNLVPVRLEGEPGKPSEALAVAMSEPMNLTALDEVQFRTGKRVSALLATESSVDRAIRKHYHGEDISEDVSFRQDPESIQFSGPEVAADDLMVVQGRLEEKKAEASGTGSAPRAPALDDPFAELESLAKEPPPATPSSDVEPATEPATNGDEPDSFDVDVDFDSIEENPSEEDLPEVEILEELPPTAPPAAVDAPAAKPVAVSQSPTPETTSAAAEEDSGDPVPPPPVEGDKAAFGTSGELLGGPIREVSESGEGIEVGEQVPALVPDSEPAAEKTGEPLPKAVGKSAMQELLSRVGVGVGGANPEAIQKSSGQPATEPADPLDLETPDEEDLEPPPVEEFSAEEISAEAQRLLEQIESGQSMEKLPKVMKSSHLIAVIIRLLLKKEIISESEFLEELKRH